MTTTRTAPAAERLAGSPRLTSIGAGLLTLGSVALAGFDVFARSVHSGRDGRLGTIGFVVAVIGMALAAVDGVATLITRNPAALRPAYPVGTLLLVPP